MYAYYIFYQLQKRNDMDGEQIAIPKQYQYILMNKETVQVMKLEQYLKLYRDVNLRSCVYFWTHIHRPNIDEEAMDMIQEDVVLHHNFDDDVVGELKPVTRFQWMDIMPEILVAKGL